MLLIAWPYNLASTLHSWPICIVLCVLAGRVTPGHGMTDDAVSALR